MNKGKLLLNFIFQITILVSGFSKDEPTYKASLISPELLKNAKAVVRKNSVSIEVDGDKASENHTFVITILNKNGNDLSKFQELYDVFIRINSINIRVFDSEGKKVKTYFGSDIKDYSAINGFSLYEDNRVKYFDPEYKNYPYTIEFTFSKKLKSTIFLPIWQAYPDYNCSVEKSSLIVSLKNNTKIRYLERNVPQLCQVEENKTFETTLLQQINTERRSQGLPLLSPDSKLFEAAEKHSFDMGCNHFFSHVNPEGQLIYDRIKAQGYIYSTVAEVIFAGSGNMNAPQEALKAWLNNAGYKAHLLDPAFTQVGIGAVHSQGSPYEGYFTVVFASPAH